MWRAKTEIINGCEKLNIKYLMTNDADAINLKSKVFNKFTSSGKSSHRLFESMINDVSYRGSEPLLLLRDYPYKNKVFVFYDKREGDDVFQFSSLQEFLCVYDECALFTFYITDSDFNFLISYTSEESLVCSGFAADWLESIT